MTPRDETDLAEAIRSAKSPLSVRGGGTRGMAPPGTPLSTAALTGVVDYEPGALTVILRAGTPVTAVDHLLAAQGQRLPFDPMDHRALLGTTGEPTIGGVIAANVSGPARVAVGAARDFLLGVRFVDGTGTLIRNGGRVMKNVTGYDLTRLVAGARGRLGVLTEVALKVLPRPGATLTLVLRGLPPDRAVAAMAAALGSPFDVNGAAHDPEVGLTCLRIEGFAGSVAYRAERLATLLAPFAPAEPLDDATLWPRIRDLPDWGPRPGAVWRVHTRPSRAPDLIARAAPLAARLDWGGALLWLLMPEGTDLRARLGAFDGHATVVRGAPHLPRLHPEAPAIATLTRGIAQRFDPRGILAGVPI
jgi:glycolate oxidase FAD binding subunit